MAAHPQNTKYSQIPPRGCQYNTIQYNTFVGSDLPCRYEAQHIHRVVPRILHLSCRVLDLKEFFKKKILSYIANLRLAETLSISEMNFIMLDLQR